jgi:hypothetical protein
MIYETAEIPFLKIGKRAVLTDAQALAMPWVREFIDCFPDCFEYIPSFNVWAYYPDGDAPKYADKRST